MQFDKINFIRGYNTASFMKMNERVKRLSLVCCELNGLT